MGSNTASGRTTIIIHSDDEESDQDRGGGRGHGHSEAEEEEEVEEVDGSMDKQGHTPPSDSVTSYMYN